MVGYLRQMGNFMDTFTIRGFLVKIVKNLLIIPERNVKIAKEVGKQSPDLLNQSKQNQFVRKTVVLI